MRPICVKCQVQYKIKEVGVYVKELFKQGEIYRVWACDLYACPKCGHEIIGAFALKPIAQNFNLDDMATARELIDQANELTKVDKRQRVFVWKEY